MTSAALLNLFAWSLQVAIVVAAASLIARVLHVDAPGARYAWWRLVLVLCLALPVLQPWQHAAAIPGTLLLDARDDTPSPRVAGTGVAPTDAAILFARRGAAATLITVTLALGTALRLVWLAAGLFRLGRLRQSGADAGCSELCGEVQALMDVRAEFRCVDALRQPATFGILRPVVLLPASLADLPGDLQRAVVAHELWHVRRRDWAWVLAEEALRSLLWFHPAMWWLISRVQSSREEVVDELTVLITNARRSYLEALLAFADQPRTFPATPFAQRKHLFTRMLLVSREAAMSSRRIVGSCAGMLLGVMIAGSYAAAAFPLTAPAPAANVAGQTPPRDRRPSEPGPATAREISLEAQLARGSGEPGAWVELAMLQEQRSAIAMAESTLLAMRRAQPGKTDSYHALAGLYRRSGQFDRAIGVLEEATALNPSDPNGYQIIVTFLSERAKDPSLAAADRLGYIRQGIAVADRALTVKPAFLEAMIYKSLLLRTQASLESDATAQQALLGEPDALRNEALKLRQALPAQMTFVPAGGVPPPPPPPPPAPYAVTGDVLDRVRQVVAEANVDSTKPLRVGGSIGMPAKIKDVRPVYPPDARAAGVQGVVILEAVIDETGSVSSARVLRSIPLLDQAALDALRQWQFTPTLLNGVPVSVTMTVTINFTTTQ
jgi:TonB family protein